MYAAANAETEKLWNEYFSDPNQWWDNRAKKVRWEDVSVINADILLLVARVCLVDVYLNSFCMEF